MGGYILSFDRYFCLVGTSASWQVTRVRVRMKSLPRIVLGLPACVS